MLRALSVLATLSVTVVIAAEAGSTTVVRGVVMRGPVSPVCVEGRPCATPLAFSTVVFSRGRVDVARAATDRLGRFSLRLTPGAYGVKVVGQGPLARLSPRAVRIHTSEPTLLRLELDTGIRAPGPRVGG